MKNVHYISTFLIFIISFGLQATTYYVSKNGDDNNSGTSENMAWKTINKAANTLEAGDEVVILDGTYEEQVIPKNSGNTGKYIVYRAKNNGKVIIDGENLGINIGRTALFFIENKEYIKVIGIKAQNFGKEYDLHYDQAGFMMIGSHHIYIENCETYNTFSSGIIARAYTDPFTPSHHIYVYGNTIQRACNGGEQECISMTAGTYEFEIKDNEVFDGSTLPLDQLHGGEGIDAKQGAHDGKIHHNYVHDLPRKLGIYVDAYSEHTYKIDVYNNTIHDCADGGMALSSEAGGLLEDINVYNNIAYHNKHYGLNITSWDASITNNHPMKNIKVINNTFYNNKWNGVSWGGGIVMENLQSEGVIIDNNICSENIEQIMIVDNVNLSELTLRNNLVFGNQISGLGFNNNIVEDPEFVDEDSANFHLKSTSAAIDAGNSNHAPTTDFDDNTRPVNGISDIGAFEYGSTLSTDEYHISLNKAIVYPNPFKDETIIKINNNENLVYTLKLYNSYGQIVKTISNISGSQIKMNRGSLNNGVYFFQILYGGKSHAEGKLMIK